MNETKRPTRTLPVRELAAVVLGTAIAVALAGCGSSDKEAAPGLGAAKSSASSIVAAGEESAAPIDVCSLLSAEDISALLGATVEGAPSDSACMWENPDNLESVSIEIGSPGTAINGTLPPPEEGFPDLTTPGPDGMRFYGSGAVEFAAGHRSNTVQVAVLSMVSDGSANDAAVELARKIGPQLPDE